jgi:hypothetical protein
MSGRRKKAILLVVKCTIAVGLLAWLVSKVHLRDSTQTIDGRQEVVPGLLTIAERLIWPLLVLGALCFLVSMIIIIVRWWMLLRIQRIRIPLWEAARLTFLGQFFNTVAPGAVGGDLVKAYYVSKHTPKKAAVLVSVFVDRVMGLTELTLLAGVMVGVTLALGRPLAQIRDAAVITGIVFAAVVFILAFLLSRRFRSAFHLQRLYQRLPIAHHFKAAGDAAVLYRKRLPVLVRAVLMTVGAHIAFVGAIALVGESLQLPVAWHAYFLYVPLIYIIGAVPISPGGVGVIEAAFFHFFVHVEGCAASAAFALAVLARLIPIFWGLPGAVVAVRGPRLPKGEAIERELGLGPGAK